MTQNQKSFIDPESVLFQAGLKLGQTVADLGAGSGFYALAAAKITGQQGMVHVADAKESALEHVAAEARMRGHKGLKTYRCDLDLEEITSCKLPGPECDMVVLANVAHEVKNRKNLFKHAYALLKTGGKLVVVDWNEAPSPIGPAPEKRIKEDDVIQLAKSGSLKYVNHIDADGYHFALVFEK